MESEVIHVQLCDPMDCSHLGSCIHGIFRAKILACVAISFSRGFPDPGFELGSSALQAGSHQGIKELGMSVNESDKARNPIMKCESKI